MLADPQTYPPSLPPGFSYLENEPAFDPAKHLALEPPSRIWSLEEFGYAPDHLAQFASPVAATTPVRILSDEGIAALQEVLAQLEARVISINELGDESLQRRVYFGNYHSRFIRDLMGCPEMIDFLSAVFQTPLAVHSMGHLACQINFANEEPGGKIADWHHDIVGFTAVLTMHDAAELDGGHFVYFRGPREEGQALLDAGESLPEEKIIVGNQTPIGHATLLQGSAILHSALPMAKAGFRCNVINSYVSRDLRAPDPNRAYLVRDFYPKDVLNPTYHELARHVAWLGHGKLGTLLHEMPWNGDRQRLAEALREALIDVERGIAQLEKGDLSLEEYDAFYRECDRRQMSDEPFLPTSGGAKRRS